MFIGGKILISSFRHIDSMIQLLFHSLPFTCTIKNKKTTSFCEGKKPHKSLTRFIKVVHLSYPHTRENGKKKKDEKKKISLFFKTQPNLLGKEGPARHFILCKRLSSLFRLQVANYASNNNEKGLLILPFIYGKDSCVYISFQILEILIRIKKPYE